MTAAAATSAAVDGMLHQISAATIGTPTMPEYMRLFSIGVRTQRPP